MNYSPTLVLNSDFRPLSYFPLSLWSWQETIKAVFLDRVNILSEYEDVIHSPSFEIKLPSVISLKDYVNQTRDPAFTRFNVFLRDSFTCQYCKSKLPTQQLTFDHVLPRSLGGRTSWSNVVTACQKCNFRKGNKILRSSGLSLKKCHLNLLHGSYKKMVEVFLLTFYTRVGGIIFIGTLSWKKTKF